MFRTFNRPQLWAQHNTLQFSITNLTNENAQPLVSQQWRTPRTHSVEIHFNSLLFFSLAKKGIALIWVSTRPLSAPSLVSMSVWGICKNNCNCRLVWSIYTERTIYVPLTVPKHISLLARPSRFPWFCFGCWLGKRLYFCRVLADREIVFNFGEK